jgi:uncharacterized protein with PIN domain
VPDAPQGVVYIDTSALGKLVVREAESDALEHALPDLDEFATSAITSIELARAVARARADGTAEVADDYAILALPPRSQRSPSTSRSAPRRLRSHRSSCERSTRFTPHPR